MSDTIDRAHVRCRKHAGFTVLELLLVLCILGILAGIAIPAYRDYELRAQMAEALIFIGDAKAPIADFYARWGRLPSDNAEAGLRPADTVRGKYLRSLTVRDGVIVAAVELGKDLGHGDVLQRTLTMRPWLNAAVPTAPILWSCGAQVPEHAGDYRVVGEIAAAPAEGKYLPSACRP